MMKAVIYARVSGDDSKTATSSIEAQLEAGRKYAADNGYDIVGEFVETPNKQTSGADWLPEIDKAMKLAKAGGYDVLIVHKVDRLARDKYKWLSIETNLEYVGVRVEYVDGQFADSKEGRLLKDIVSGFAQFEREAIAERLQQGICRAVSAGSVTVAGSKAPFGYGIIEADGRRQLVINESEVAIVRVIFDLYGNKGYSLRGIRDYLEDLGIEKPGKGLNHLAIREKAERRGHRPSWSLGTLKKILNNETYIGRWHYRKTKRTKVGDGKYRPVPRPRSEWLLIEVLPIIDEVLFCKVQKRLDMNKRQKRKQHSRLYILGGMIRCGRCGISVSGRTNLQQTKHMGLREYGRYMCNARNTPKRYGYSCDLPFFKMSDVDSTVWEWIRNMILDPVKLRQALEGYKTRQADNSNPLEGMLEANEAKMISLEEEKDRLIKAYSAGVLSLDDIAKEKSAIDKQIAAFNDAIGSLRAELKETAFTVEEMETIEALAAQYQEEVEISADDPEKQRYIMQLLGVEIVLLTTEDGRKWADVSCKLGEERCAVPFNAH